MYSGKDFQDKSHKFQLMAKFFPNLNEFRIYTINKEKNPSIFSEDGHVAKVIFNRKKKQFIIKNKYCNSCTKKPQYFCEESKKWLFQEELGYYFVRDEDIAPKVHIKYTFAYVSIPQINQNYEMKSWCPRYIQEKEKRSFSMYDGKPDEHLHEILNNQDYRGSIRDAYDKHKKDEKKTSDRILLRARKPLFKKIDRSLSLNFNGRVKKASRKNVQIEYKFKRDDKYRIVLQHGKLANDIFILDYGYPFTTIQAFAISLGLYYFKKDEHQIIT
eukprot:403345707